MLDTKINYMVWLSRVIISYLEEWVEEDGELAKKKNRKGRRKERPFIHRYLYSASTANNLFPRFRNKQI